MTGQHGLYQLDPRWAAALVPPLVIVFGQEITVGEEVIERTDEKDDQ